MKPWPKDPKCLPFSDDLELAILRLIGFDQSGITAIKKLAEHRKMPVLALIRQSVGHYQESVEPCKAADALG